jgi:SlyX protein
VIPEAACKHAAFSFLGAGMMPLLFARIAVSAEDRFIDIEIKLGEQENLVDTLNRTIYEQGRRIDQLEALVAKLAEHVGALRDAGQGPGHERPPHY